MPKKRRQIVGQYSRYARRRKERIRRERLESRPQPDARSRRQSEIVASDHSYARLLSQMCNNTQTEPTRTQTWPCDLKDEVEQHGYLDMEMRTQNDFSAQLRLAIKSENEDCDLDKDACERTRLAIKPENEDCNLDACERTRLAIKSENEDCNLDKDACERTSLSQTWTPSDLCRKEDLRNTDIKQEITDDFSDLLRKAMKLETANNNSLVTYKHTAEQERRSVSCEDTAEHDKNNYVSQAYTQNYSNSADDFIITNVEQEIIVGGCCSNRHWRHSQPDPRPPSKLMTLANIPGCHRVIEAFKCDSCNKSFTSEKILESHKLSVHYIEAQAHIFGCNVCYIKCKSHQELIQHKKLLHSSQRQIFRCGICDVIFKTEKILNVHTAVLHKGRPLCVCGSCRKPFSNLTSLKKHVENVHHRELSKNVGLTHDWLRSFKCHECGEFFPNGEKLKNHKSTFHTRARSERQEVTCYLCKRKFKSQSLLDVHIAEHHFLNHRWKCRFCHKKFLTEAALRDHVAAHLAGTCHFCGEFFTTEKTLQKHIKEYHAEMLYLYCQICGSAFKSSYELTQHLRIHCEKSRYLCDLCGKMFRGFTSVKNHMYAHLRIRPYKCGNCTKSFHSASGLFHHRKLRHQCKTVRKISNLGQFKGKQFNCEMCGEVLSNYFRIQTHLKYHSENHPYKCGLCVRSYKTRASLYCHRAKEHKLCV